MRREAFAALGTLMTRKLFLLTAMMTLLPLSLAAQNPTADEIINRYLTVRGGIAKIKAVQSERVVGTISFGPGFEGPFLVERARPLKMHMQATLNSQTIIRVYDGKSSGWVYNPFLPAPAVEAMGAADLRNVTDEADFDGPFVDYKSKGNQIEYVGKDEVEAKPVYKVKLTNKNGEVSYFSFDIASGYLLRWQGTRRNGDKDVPWESLFRDYREVAGIKYPFLIDSNAPGTDQTQKITADKIEIGIAIDDSHFAKPAPPAAPAPPPAPAADPAKPN